MMVKPDDRNRSATAVRVRVDPRVELLSIAFRVAGAKEYQHGLVKGYATDVDRHFGPYADHPAIRRILELRQQDGISHDAVVKLAVHLDETRTFDLMVPLEDASGLGSRWRVETAREFAEDLDEFAQTSDFGDFFARHENLYSTTESRLQEVLAGADLEWLDSYFGESSRSIEVIPGMLTGRASYGATVTVAGARSRYAIVGVESVDSDGLPVFDRSIIEAVVHELCHSYVKPLLDAHADELENAGVALYITQQARMQAQAYRSGYTVVNETLTRACTHRYLEANGTPEEIEGDFTYNLSRGFVWLESVSDFLEEYEAQRDRYTNLEAFAPELVRFFSAYTEGLPQTAAELSAMRPRVVHLIPANGDTEVDPKLKAIVVTFDRPMQKDAWSVVGGGPKYPDTDTPSYDASGLEFRLPVKLEPDREYELWLNRGPFAAFASVEGIPLASLHVRFQTRAE